MCSHLLLLQGAGVAVLLGCAATVIVLLRSHSGTAAAAVAAPHAAPDVAEEGGLLSDEGGFVPQAHQATPEQWRQFAAGQVGGAGSPLRAIVAAAAGIRILSPISKVVQGWTRLTHLLQAQWQLIAH